MSLKIGCGARSCGVGLAVLRDGHLHQEHHRRRFFPGHDLRLRVLRLHVVDVLGREGGDEIDLPRLERGHLGDGILDHADDDPVEVGLAGHEVLVEPVQHGVAAVHVLDQPERPAARQGFRLALLPVLQRVLLGGGRAVDHEAAAVAGEHVQEERVGVLEPDLDRVGIEHLDAVDRFVEGPHPRLGLGVSEAVDAELDGGRVHLGAVVEEDVLPELEGVDEPVGGHLPRLGGVAHELAVGRDVDETAADVHGDPHHFVAGRGVEIEVGDLVAVADAERAPALRRLGQRRGGHEDERHYQSDQDGGVRTSRKGRRFIGMTPSGDRVSPRNPRLGRYMRTGLLRSGTCGFISR